MRSLRGLHLLIAVAAAGVVGIASQVRTSDGARPQGPPATLVGQETCATCHADLAAQYARSAHGHLAPFEQRGQPGGCESCHGPGSRHAQSGDPADIRSFKDDVVGREASRTCFTCHQMDQGMHWPGSTHDSSEVGCTNCHVVHQSREVAPGLMPVEGGVPRHTTAPAARGSLAKREPDLCFGCHQEKRAKFWSTSHHPVREGYMRCSDCHQVHGTGQENTLLKSSERPNDVCLTCHASKQGPFVFEHPPVEEDCLTCHDPHGAVANSLLKQGEPFLCLQCHEMHFHNARVSSPGPVTIPSGSATNANGPTSFMQAFGTRCSACHAKIHGSDMPSQGISGRGKALLR